MLRSLRRFGAVLFCLPGDAWASAVGWSPDLPLPFEDYFDVSDVTFVQIGANLGQARGDRIWPYATRFGWAGAVLEPNPFVFRRLAANYAPFPAVAPPAILVLPIVGCSLPAIGRGAGRTRARRVTLRTK